MLVPMYAKAETYTEYSQEFNYVPSGNFDSQQNRLDENATTNKDTWNPVPQGVYYGSFSRESSIDMSLVPDTDTRVCAAQVMKFPAAAIGAGSSHFIVRSPFGDTHYRCKIDIYKIERGVNWTFEYNNTYGVHTNDYLRINFTENANQTELIGFTYANYATDLSPTNGNDYYNSDGRPYDIMYAPIVSEQYYLFVGTAWYNSTTNPMLYFTADSLSQDWNRSTVGTYTEIAPDNKPINVYNLNVSLGWSIDFLEGFGAHMTGINIYEYGDAQVLFYKKIPEVNLNQYLTFMFPFYATSTNVSVRTLIRAFDFAGNSELIIDDTQEWNDFILVGTTDILSNVIVGGWKNGWEGWLYIRLWFGNETRLRFHLRDMSYYNQADGFNASWYGNPANHDYEAWSGVHSPEFRYMPERYFSWNDTTENLYHVVHWQIQSYVQLNDYYWQQTAPPAVSEVQDYSWLQAAYLATDGFYGIGKLWINFDEETGQFSLTPLWGQVTEPARYLAGVIVATYDRIAETAGRVRDKLNDAWDALKEFGTWLYKIGQAIIGVISWFIETLIYYGSIILAIFILVLAFVVLFLPIWGSAKVAQIIINVSRGRSDLAVAEMGDIAGRASSLVRRGG